jgi:hypothetical protein
MLSSLHIIHDRLVDVLLSGNSADRTYASLCGKAFGADAQVQGFLTKVARNAVPHLMNPDITIYKAELVKKSWTIRYTKRTGEQFVITIHATSPYFTTDERVNIVGVAHLHMILRQNIRTA